MAVNKSKESCVLCSLTVRDFLRRVGFDANVRSVATIMRATQDDKELHSLGIGSPEDPRVAPEGYWTGHMVVLVDRYLIDTTLYRARRPAWPDLAGMMALPIAAPQERGQLYGLDVITGATIGGDDGYQFDIAWLDYRKNRSWRRGPDARDRGRREPVVRRMIERFGVWQGEKAA
jgi:hypothetical protein